MSIKRKRIRKLRPTFVSLVKRGANLQPGLLKSEDGDGVDIVCLTKAAASEGLLHSLVYVPDLVDSHGHFMGAEDIREACHAHAREGLALDLKHDCNALGKDQAHVVENLILQGQDDRFPSVDHKGREIDHTGAWAQVIKIEDPKLLELAEAGELTEVSLYAPAGNFELVDELPAVSKTDNDTSMEIEKILEGLTAALAKQTEAILASNAELAKSLAKSDEDGEADAGTTEDAIAKGTATNEDGSPKWDGDPSSTRDIVEFRRRVQDYALDRAQDSLGADTDKILKFLDKREAIAKARADEDKELGFADATDPMSIVKTLGLDGDVDGFINEEASAEPARTSDEFVNELVKEINASQPEVI